MQWIIMPFRRMFDISGRSRRLEFWLLWLVAMLLQLVAGYLDAANSQPAIFGGMAITTLFVTLIFFLPAAAVGIRRLHDIDRSGGWMMLFGLPYFGWLASAEIDAQGVLPAVALLLGSVVLVVLLVQPSITGNNKYGPNPKVGIAERHPAD